MQLGVDVARGNEIRIHVDQIECRRRLAFLREVRPEVDGQGVAGLPAELGAHAPDVLLEELPDKDIVLGVIDLSTHAIETAATVVERVKRALPHINAERVILAPDCGMKYLPRAVAFGKLQAMCAAAELLRAEHAQ